MVKKIQPSIQSIALLIAVISWSSFSVGLAAGTAVCGDEHKSAIRANAGATATAQLPTEAIDRIPRGNLTSVILSDSRFKILGAVLRATGLLDSLQSGELFTLFAPTDEAFNALPDGVLDALMKPENIGQLTNLLKYHVIPGRVTAEELSSGTVESLQGSPLSVDVGSDQVRVEEATLIDSDVAASNGMIHVIDKVMILPE